MSHSETMPAGHFHHCEPETAYHGAKLGMWIFLATEVHLFGGLFCTFALYRYKLPEMFNEFATHLNFWLGGLNTLFLLASSYWMVRAVDSAQKGLNWRCKRQLEYTMILGCGFFVVKYFEYKSKLTHIDPVTGLLDPITPSTNVFYALYYCMTGLHALHVLVGIGLLLWVWNLARKERFSVTYYTPVEVSGLYWHLVDVIWIFLFPIVYLLGGATLFGGAH